MKKNALDRVTSLLSGDLAVRTAFCIPSFPSLTSVQMSLCFPFFVLDFVGLEDSTAPYEPAGLNFVNFVKFKTFTKPYKKGTWSTSPTLPPFFSATVRRQLSESEEIGESIAFLERIYFQLTSNQFSCGFGLPFRQTKVVNGREGVQAGRSWFLVLGSSFERRARWC